MKNNDAFAMAKKIESKEYSYDICLYNLRLNIIPIPNPIDTNGMAEIEVPKVVSILMNPSTNAGAWCKKAVECATNEEELKRAIRMMLRDVGRSCANKMYKAYDTDVSNIIKTYKCDTVNNINDMAITHELAELVYIMGKDIHGKLGTEETALLEKNMTKWQEQIQIMREQLKTIDH